MDLDLIKPYAQIFTSQITFNWAKIKVLLNF